MSLAITLAMTTGMQMGMQMVGPASSDTGNSKHNRGHWPGILATLAHPRNVGMSL